MAAAGVPMVGGGPMVEVIYGKPTLPDVSRVLACLYEKEVEFKLVDMHEGQHMPQDFLRLQAAARLPVPCLKDGDTTLFESRAICRHLVDKYKDSGNKYLLGRDYLQRVSIEQWLKIEEHSFDPPSWRLIFHLAFPPAAGLPDPDRALITESERRLNEVLDVYEQRLSERKYLASNEFSLADLSHLSNSHFLATSEECGYLFNKRKNVSRWWSKISNRPSWKEVVKLLDEFGTLRGTRPPAAKSVVQSLSEPRPSSPGVQTIRLGHIPGYTDTTSHPPPSAATPSAQPDSRPQQSSPQPIEPTPSAQTTQKTQLTSTGQSSCQPPFTALTSRQFDESESAQPILPLAPTTDLPSTGQSSTHPLLAAPTTTRQPAMPASDQSNPPLKPNSPSIRPASASEIAPKLNTTIQPIGPNAKKKPAQGPTFPTTPPAQTASEGQRTSASAQRTIQPAGPGTSSSLPPVVPASQSSNGTTPTIPATSPTPQPGTPKAQPDPQMKKDSRTDSTTSNNISPPENDVNSTAKTTPPAQTASGGQRTPASAQRTIQPAGPDTSSSLPPVIRSSQSSSGTTPTVPATSSTPQPGTPTAQPDPRMKKDSRTDSTATNSISPPENDVNSMAKTTPPAQTDSGGQRTSDSAQRTIQPAGPGTSSSLPPVIPSSQSSSGTTPTVPATSSTPQQGTPKAQPDPQMKKDSQTDSTTSNSISPPAKTDVNSGKTTSSPAKTASNVQPASDLSKSTRQPVVEPGTSKAQPDLESKLVSQTDSAEQRTLKMSSKEPDSNVKPTTKPESTAMISQPTSASAQPSLQQTDPGTPITPLQELVSRLKENMNFGPSTPKEPSIPSQPTSASAQLTVQPDAEDTMSVNPSTKSSTSRDPIVPATPLTPQQASPEAQPDLQTKQATSNASPPKTATPPAQTAPIAQQTPAPLETDVNSVEKTTLPSQFASNDKTTSGSSQLETTPPNSFTQVNPQAAAPTSTQSTLKENSKSAPPNLTTQPGAQSPSTTDQSTPPSTRTESTSQADSSGESTDKPSPPQST